MVAEKIIFTNARGRSITSTNRLPFLLQSVEGKGDVSADIQMQRSPYQDGSTYIDSVLDSREIALIINIKANDRNELNELKSEISSIFNPKLGLGKLEYFNGEVHAEIQCVPSHVPSFPTGDAKGKWYQRVMITLVAPNPYWKTPVINSDELAAFVPLFEFPFEDEFEIGMEGHETVINNVSDVPIPITITIQGPTVNPKLMNMTTGQMIRIKRELLAEDVLVIDTDERTVLLNGVDVFPYIDLDTEFFSLTFGENILKYTADSGTDTAILIIQTQQRYNAI